MDSLMGALLRVLVATADAFVVWAAVTGSNCNVSIAWRTSADSSGAGACADVGGCVGGSYFSGDVALYAALVELTDEFSLP